MEPNFEKTLKKAKLKNTLRIILITIVTLIIAISLFYSLSNKIVSKKSDELNKYLFLRNEIAEPNVQIDSQVLSSSSATGGEIVSNKSKNISGYVVPWDTIRATYSLVSFNVDYNEFLSGIHMTKDNVYSYNKQTKQKTADFYHPDVDYSGYLKEMPNDLKLMDEKKAEVSEMAISFDQPVKWKEVRDKIPTGITPKWLYMTSNISDKKPGGPTGYGTYGFSLDEEDQQDSFEGFLDNLQQYDDKERDEVIQNFIKKNKDKELSDTEILGILVTGENKDLKKMQDFYHLRAASVGVTVEINPYIKVEKE